MEKTIPIDGRNVTFKTTGSLQPRYMTQFKRDIFADSMAMVPMLETMEKMKDSDSKNLTKADLSKIDFTMFYNLLWTMAKIADESTPPPLDWLDTFNSFPIIEIIPQMREMIELSIGVSSSSSKKKKTNPPVKQR